MTTDTQKPCRVSIILASTSALLSLAACALSLAVQAPVQAWLTAGIAACSCFLAIGLWGRQKDWSKHFSERFRQAAERVGRGELDVDLVADGNERSRRVVDSFHQMTALLRQRTQAMDRAIDEARQASAARARFLDQMNHEIRTPLNGILGTVQLMLHHEPRPDQIADLQIVERSAQNLLSLIEDLISLSQADANSIELEQQDFGVRGLIDSIVENHAGLAASLETELAARVDAEVPSRLHGDARRIRQILGKLLTICTARREKGKVLLRVESLPGVLTKDGRGLYSFEILDDSGIRDMEEERRFHDPIVGGESQEDRRALEYALCHALAKALDGRIDMRNDPGSLQGFRILVPLAPPEDPFASEAELPRFEGMRTLVVERNKSVRESLCERLRFQGMEVLGLDSGLEAIQCLETHAGQGQPLDTIFVELELPDLDAFSILEQMELRSAIPPTNFVLLVPQFFPALDKQAEETGIGFCLSKPVLDSQLRTCLEELQAGRLLNTGLDRAREARRSLHGRHKVLVVEDNPVNQRVLCLLLDRLGYEYHAYENGQEAVLAFKATQFDIVLMDLSMPIMDGYEATRALRELEGTDRHTPIVALTAQADHDVRRKASEAGVDDLIKKPYAERDIEGLLIKWVSVEQD